MALRGSSYGGFGHYRWSDLSSLVAETTRREAGLDNNIIHVTFYTKVSIPYSQVQTHETSLIFVLPHPLTPRSLLLLSKLKRQKPRTCYEYIRRRSKNVMTTMNAI
jgi:hypothetical protein